LFSFGRLPYCYGAGQQGSSGYSSARRGMRAPFSMLKIALIQTRISENVPENLENASRLIKQAARRGAELVCLPELFAHRYFGQYYFSPGNLGYVQVDTGKAVIAPLICYDQWYPEAARVNTIQGAQIIFYPTAIGWFKALKRDEPFSARRWEYAMRAHASLNGVFVA